MRVAHPLPSFKFCDFMSGTAPNVPRARRVIKTQSTYQGALSLGLIAQERCDWKRTAHHLLMSTDPQHSLHALRSPPPGDRVTTVRADDSEYTSCVRTLPFRHSTEGHGLAHVFIVSKECGACIHTRDMYVVPEAYRLHIYQMYMHAAGSDAITLLRPCLFSRTSVTARVTIRSFTSMRVLTTRVRQNDCWISLQRR